MKILVIGSGGREHALAWKLKQSAGVDEVLVAPGNAGTASEAHIRNVPVAADDLPALLRLAQEEGVDFTVVGPEVPLVAGVTDLFAAHGLACFGPSAAAAQLEGSKEFSKEFLVRYDIPTAAYESFTEVDKACAFVRAQGAPIVVKADGLAAGKGVVVAHSIDKAIAAIEDMLSGNAFGKAGAKVVIEEFLLGEEVSFICLCDGKHAVPFASSQDHKAVLDGDKGANTGGMGAYSPAPVLDAALHELVMRRVIEPTLKGMAADGIPYVGFLYAGLMITPDKGPKVIEFNCRFGDPEAQPVMMRLQSDLLAACRAAFAGELDQVELNFDDRTALGVVMAAGGYPSSYTTGELVQGLDAVVENTKVFHAGTRQQGTDIVTSGGRVLCVVGLGDDVAAAQAKAYERVAKINFNKQYFRRDIGHRALSRA